jgi:hypothetical protein
MYNFFYDRRYKILFVGIIFLSICGIIAISLSSQYKHPKQGLCIVNDITMNDFDPIIHSDLVRNNQEIQSFDIVIECEDDPECIDQVGQDYQIGYAYHCYWKKNQLSDTIAFSEIYQDHNDYYENLAIDFTITGIVISFVLMIFSMFLDFKGPRHDSYQSI